MTAISKKVKRMDKESSEEPMEVVIMVNGEMTLFTEKVSSYGQTETNMMVSGQRVKCMGWVNFIG